MGIKGIYGEIGPGERVALAKLAVDHFELTGRPFRIAIDISIWQFQIQSAQGGSNPAIRTLYYRLLRILSLSIQPLFVFDGPGKPPFKRNKRSGPNCAALPNCMAKQLLKLFGFPAHNAPGEAEAECALLQQEGIVDAVLSEDVDTLMFGCGLTLRNWSSEDSKGKTPTHVSVYDARSTKKGRSGLDREGMVLVALMSGGDYITEGIPGCGIKLACEAARAGFGESLCSMSRADASAMEIWRQDLASEIQTNKNKYFRIKHMALRIPETFPDREVLGYYTHPVVSSAAKVAKLKAEITWDGELDVPGLRIFVGKTFDWTNKMGAKKFIRGLAPALLILKLRMRGNRRESGFGDIVLTAINEMELVRSICGKRTHFSTGAIPELRLIYHPLDIVGIDLDAEPDDAAEYVQNGLAASKDYEKENEEYPVESNDCGSSRARSAIITKKKTSLYDPSNLDKIWVPKCIAQVGIPLKVEDWDEARRNPVLELKSKAATKKTETKGGMLKGSLNQYVSITKPSKDFKNSDISRMQSKIISNQPTLSLQHHTPTPKIIPRIHPVDNHRNPRLRFSPPQDDIDPLLTENKPESKQQIHSKSHALSRKVRNQQIAAATNPWTFAKSSSPPTSRTIRIPTPGLDNGGEAVITPGTSYHENRLNSQNQGELPISLLPSLCKQSVSSLPTNPAQAKRSPETLSKCLATNLSPSLHKRAIPISALNPLRTSKLNTYKGGISLDLKYQRPDKLEGQLSCHNVDQRLFNGLKPDALALKQTQSSVENTVPQKKLGLEKAIANLAPSSASLLLPKNGSDSSLSRETDSVSNMWLTSESKKKLLIERESLPGAWKLIEEDELKNARGRGIGRIWRESQVEILDMIVSP